MVAEIPNVVVIMSVYRYDSLVYLKQAVHSIISQSYQSTTLFIFRDGPVDIKVDEYLNQISKDCSSVNYLTSEKNCGLAVALNRLIDVILEDGKADYVARMDSDDISRIDRISKQVGFFSNNPQVDVCGTSCHEFGASYALDIKHLPETHEELLSFSVSRCPFIHPSVMFRASVFKDGNRYPENTTLTEDMAFWFELLKKGYKFANINEVLLDYRLTENTIDRRKGLGKAFSEVWIRTINMIALKQYSLKNVFLISSRIVFHLLPTKLLKFAYKRAR